MPGAAWVAINNMQTLAARCRAGDEAVCSDLAWALPAMAAVLVAAAAVGFMILWRGRR